MDTFVHNGSEPKVLVKALRHRHLFESRLLHAMHLEMLEELKRTGIRQAALDFTKVSTACLAASGTVLELHRAIQNCGGRLVLCALSPLVSHMFRLTGLIDPHAPDGLGAAVVPVLSDVPAAVAFLKRQSHSPTRTYRVQAAVRGCAGRRVQSGEKFQTDLEMWPDP
jgi:hypothetical protein